MSNIFYDLNDVDILQGQQNNRHS